MNKVQTLVVIIGLLIAVCFSSGCSFPKITASTPSPTNSIILVTDSFTMVPWNQQNSSKATADFANITDFSQIKLPYNKYGVYVSKVFFVNIGEMVQVTVNSDVPVSVDGHEVNMGLGTMIRQGVKGLNSSNWLQSYNLSRTPNGFTTTLDYSLDIDGDCTLQISNNSIQNCNCQIIISIPK